jgi:hypothetical protein
MYLINTDVNPITSVTNDDLAKAWSNNRRLLEAQLAKKDAEAIQRKALAAVQIAEEETSAQLEKQSAISSAEEESRQIVPKVYQTKAAGK